MQNLQNELINILQHEDALVVEGQLNKNKIVEMALQVDPQLIKHLIKHDTFKTHFFTDVEGVLVFDKIKFQRFVNNKSFLPDSYTAFKNKIGLTINDGTTDNYITTKNDVVLAWPHKDCVLEGGQTKEDQKRNEIFWNETLAPDEIDRLLDPKVFTNWKKYDQQGEHEVTEISDSDNLIIKGNNLLALASLKKRYAGKVKLIYIDPPYNTGNDSFQYNDSFNQSAWISFMKTRLEISKILLSNSGSIFIQLDYNQVHYCKVLMDELFGKNCFRNEIIWQRTTNTGSSKGMANKLSNDTDSILYYSKTDSPKFNKIFKEYGEDYLKRFKAEDEYGNYRWQYMATYSQEKYKALEEKGQVRWLEGSSKPEYKQYLHELKGVPLNNLWTDIFHVNPMAKESVDFKTQKPEELLERIISISTNENDIVVDFFAGSGTTCAVAHKMKRRYITIEQMDYVESKIKNRLCQIIGKETHTKGELHAKLDYDTWGISKAVNWQGGGSFIYCELAKYNQTYVDQILEAESKEKLTAVWQQMKEKAFLSYQFDKQSFDERIEAFKTLSLDDQKKFLLEVLDKNQLYVNYSEIADETFGISKEDKRLNDMFYGKI